MSRPDWGALQQEYIAEYTRSGVSPVAWCEARDRDAGHYISTKRPACKMHEPNRRDARSGGANVGILPRRSHGVRHVWCAGNTGLL